MSRGDTLINSKGNSYKIHRIRKNEYGEPAYMMMSKYGKIFGPHSAEEIEANGYWVENAAI